MTINRKIFFFFIVLFLSACSNSASEVHYQAMPDGLKDCVVYYISDERAQNITVMRCPNSTTSTNYTVQSGKTTTHKTTIVVDGVEYIKKEGDPKP